MTAPAHLPRRIRTISDVAAYQLCCGCGVCAYLDPDIRMCEDLDQGRRPVGTSSTPDALACCPGLFVHAPEDPALASTSAFRPLAPVWGPIRSLHEGYATDTTLRTLGSSGGIVSALADSLLRQGTICGVLQVTARSDRPYLNATQLSTTRDEILACCGSRYSPASPCEALDRVETQDGPCMIVGKPCDIAAVQAARARRPALDKNIALTVAVFCAGTPSLAGTLAMLRRMNLQDLPSIRSLRYRGDGWPGLTRAKGHHDETLGETLTYEQSWGEILEAYRPWRCRLCADHTGELADIAVGDPWYREIPPGDPGRSLILARTETGERILSAVCAAGDIVCEAADPAVLPASQPNLASLRGSVWGRCLASRLLGMPAPHYTHMPLFAPWLRLPFKKKLQSVLGTMRRILTRHLKRRRPVTPLDESSLDTPSQEM